MHEVVTLSDGADCEVRVLGLFELQNEVAPEEEPGPFVYTYEVLGGQVVSKTYDAEDFANPPTRPSTTTIDPGRKIRQGCRGLHHG
jgi:hypothetical protein